MGVRIEEYFLRRDVRRGSRGDVLLGNAWMASRTSIDKTGGSVEKGRHGRWRQGDRLMNVGNFWNEERLALDIRLALLWVAMKESMDWVPRGLAMELSFSYIISCIFGDFCLFYRHIVEGGCEYSLLIIFYLSWVRFSRKRDIFPNLWSFSK